MAYRQLPVSDLPPSVTISFNIRPGVALGDAVSAVQQLAGDTLPSGGPHPRRLLRAALWLTEVRLKPDMTYEEEGYPCV